MSTKVSLESELIGSSGQTASRVVTCPRGIPFLQTVEDARADERADELQDGRAARPLRIGPGRLRTKARRAQWSNKEIDRYGG